MKKETLFVHLVVSVLLKIWLRNKNQWIRIVHRRSNTALISCIASRGWKRRYSSKSIHNDVAPSERFHSRHINSDHKMKRTESNTYYMQTKIVPSLENTLERNRFWILDQQE